MSGPSIVLASDSNPGPGGPVSTPLAAISIATINGQPTEITIALPSVSTPQVSPIATFDTSTTPRQTVTITSTTGTPAPTSASGDSSSPASSSSPSSQGTPLSTLLPAILIPVVIVLILIPVLVFGCLRYRNKRRERNRRRSPDTHGPATETALLEKKSEQPLLTLPSPFSDGERIRSGALDVDINKSLEQNMAMGEPVPLYQRHPSRENLKNTTPRAISPTLPSPGLSRTPAPRPKSEDAWPLPKRANLPSPTTINSQSSQSQALKGDPSPASNQGPFASHSNHSREALRPDSSTYASTAGDRLTASPVPAQRAGHGDPFAGKRDSDLVSEISRHPSRVHSRSNSKKDNTDTASIISAMTTRSRSGRRKSGRDADAASFISAMSPEDEPELPVQSFPFK